MRHLLLNSTVLILTPNPLKYGKTLNKKKKPQVIELTALKMVGVAELESATPCVSCKKCFFELNKL